ncbi:hypothetical protein ACE1TI_11895 [Alteribacillus sp. JSM 102045]|uniref:hypothetical protein n=1 Tax=Alteribacillus sp. JSM 102045 TaxID=1562101 RepID=UPI0035BF48C4
MSDSYKDIKELAFVLEKNINNLIQQELNKDEIAKSASTTIQKHASFLRTLQDYSEILSAPLNIPTKNDVANIAKLVIQLEEKVDALEEKIDGLKERLEQDHSSEKKEEQNQAKVQSLKETSAEKNSGSSTRGNKLRQELNKLSNTDKTGQSLEKLLNLSLLLTPTIISDLDTNSSKKEKNDDEK